MAKSRLVLVLSLRLLRGFQVALVYKYASNGFWSKVSPTHSTGLLRSDLSPNTRQCKIGSGDDPPCLDSSLDVCQPGFVYTSSRVVVVSDVHGDLEKFLEVLKRAALLSSDGKNEWIGGTAVLVQTGDILDRGPEG